VRLSSEWAAAIILFFVAIFAIHFVRRAYRQPTRVGGAPVDVPGNTVKTFDLVERAFHWSLFIILGLVALTGVAIFSAGTFAILLQAFGVSGTTAAVTASNVALHTDMLWLLLGLIVIHVVWDVAVVRSGRTVVPGRADIHDTLTRLKGFLGMGRSVQPRHGKYDAFMKLFHWGLALCLVVLGVTGLYLWNPYALMPTMSPGFENTLRILHDIFAFLLIGLIFGHIYFGVLPINWPVLRAIFTGTISGDAFNHDYDSTRWAPKGVAPPVTPAAAPTANPPTTGEPPGVAPAGREGQTMALPPTGDEDARDEAEVGSP
jgi:cytochrome b subunit of formate dehydrogenase